MKVFVDTSAIFAALVVEDESHGSARATFEKLIALGASLFTTSYVVVETAALLQARIGRRAVGSFDSDVRPLMDVTWVDGRLHDLAMRTFKQEERGGPSLVDCVSFVAMRDLRVRLAFAYDRHFETAGCRLVRTVGDLSP